MKKYAALSIMLVVVLLGVSFFANIAIVDSNAISSSIKGDVDGNGIIEIADATLIQKILAKVVLPTDDMILRGTVTGEGELCITDATAIQRYLAKLSYPECIGKQIKPSEETTVSTAPQIIVDKVTAKPGDKSVAVNISVRNNPGIASLAFDVNYDKSVLTLMNFVYNSDVVNGASTIPFNERAFPPCLSMINGSKNVTGDWVFATLYFDVSSSAKGNCEISVSYDENNIYDISEENVKFDVVKGAISVSNDTEETDNTKVYTVTFADKDGNVIETQEVKEGEAPVYPSAPQIEGYTFVKWDKTITKVTADVTIKAIYEEAQDVPSFIVESVDASKGDKNVAVNVAVKNNPGIASISLDIIYDKEHLTLKNFVYNNAALVGASTTPFNEKAYLPCLSMINGSNNITGDWIFATLYFDVSNSANGNCPITITYDENNVYNILEENINFAIVNGSINVK